MRRLAGQDMTVDSDAKLAQRLINEIAPMLHGHGPAVQSAVLADLFAMWLAGHQGPGAAEYRELAIADWLRTMRELIPVNEEMILQRLAERETKQ
jgi:hypothetical protein